MSYTNGLDKPTDYFNTKLYTGNGSTHNITGVGFQPDWVWIKNRDATDSHRVTDAVRGVAKELYPNGTFTEDPNGGLTAFDSDGFTLNSNSSYNGNNVNYASWNWKAGTSFTNDASSTGVGSIDSTGSFNNDAGFSIVSWTGTGSAGTIKHGLNSTPKAMIIKNRTTSAQNWQVYHKSNGATKSCELNTTSAIFDKANGYNNTEPTSSVFSIGSDGDVNASSASIIAYCFAEKKGYSKFGSYTGNGNADGTFVYTGFKPAFVMLKRSSNTSDWYMFDNKREGYNVDNDEIYANLNYAEDTADRLDILSNGFKMRTTGGNLNGSGETFIYMAFAENPFVTSTGIPSCAR